MDISRLKRILADHFKLEGSFELQQSEFQNNYRLRASAGTSYLLKHAPEGQTEGDLDLENQGLEYLAAQKLSLDLPTVLPAFDGQVVLADGAGRYLRVLSWLDGRLYAHVNPKSAELRRSLGAALGKLTNGLHGFDHTQAHQQFEWDPVHCPLIADHIHLVEESDREILRRVLSFYSPKFNKTLGKLPHSVIHGDANDYNIIVTEDPFVSRVAGFIDFGDMHFAPTICELAICLAYAMMEQGNPMFAASEVIQAYHAVSPISEQELTVLFPLICGRLAISVVKAAERKMADPNNAYWQISAEPAWNLLRQLHSNSPELALCHFRHACGYPPHPDNEQLISWLKSHKKTFANVVGYELGQTAVQVFDWSIGSAELGSFEKLDNIRENSEILFSEMDRAGLQIGIGRYNEPRPVYTTDAYSLPGNHGAVMRTVHLGIDVFMRAGTPLFAPLEGHVHCIVNNAGDKEYGPLLILKHTPINAPDFFTLYGHCSLSTLEMWKPGDQIEKGNKIAEIGDFPHNGNWIPHLHFQIMATMLNYIDDFPGVADPDMRELWLSICPDPNLILGIQHPNLNYVKPDEMTLLHQRKVVLGSNLSLSYHRPLHIVRGWKQYLFDTEGRKYLDTVNNIAHVGHEHLRVVESAKKQLAVLNTNTRYLHENIIEFAETLVSTLPDELEVCYFVNSGSEANELALRIARNYTGARDTFVLEQGYHGSTGTCVEVSAYKFNNKGGAGPAPHIHVFDTPDPYRGTHHGNAPRYTQNAVDKIRRSARPGTFIHESILSCAGQIVPPAEYFRVVYNAVREMGGVCIADEVQTGLGRVGTDFWAFQLFEVVPDIVTIGKPLGNGHPVAAVVCKRSLADAFDNGMEFFSSFGGNPVSCAIGLEVLKVVQEEELQAHAWQLGDEIKTGFLRLRDAFPIIGDVRGQGLFLGIEFVLQDGTPAPRQTAYFIRRMLEHRILMSADGPDHNVIKIKPPMCIDQSDVEYLLNCATKILVEDAMRNQ